MKHEHQKRKQPQKPHRRDSALALCKPLLVIPDPGGRRIPTVIQGDVVSMALEIVVGILAAVERDNPKRRRVA